MTPLQSSAKLVDVFCDLFVLGSHFRDAGNLGSVEALRTRLEGVFARAEERGKSVGVPSDVMMEGRYALAAYLDEMIINSRWPLKSQWASRPLQYEFFNEFVAGEGFFIRLDRIRSAMPVNVDLLEIFGLCLMLGFEGQYKLQDREKLKGLIEDVSREIQAKRGELPALSPHGQRPEELLDMVKRELPAWVVMVISLGIVFFFYLALSLLMSHEASSVVGELKRLLQEVKS
jgi:type VI secretion system protein ImpK